MGDKPIIRIAVPGDSAEEFMQNAAKQFRGDFFVAIDQAVGKFVRIEAPFLTGDVAVRGDAIAMPAVRNGRKGLVIRLVKLDPDSLGIPIPEPSKTLEADDTDEEASEDEFDPQPTMASPVSAAVAKSIRATASAADRAQPVRPQPAAPAKQPAEPIKLEELDDETREAVDEFEPTAATTRASDVPADLAKQLAGSDDKEPRATPAVVRRVVTPQSGIPKQGAKEDSKPTPAKVDQDADDDRGLDSAFGVPDAHEAPTVVAKAAEARRDRDDDGAPAKTDDKHVSKVATSPATKKKSNVQFLVMCLLLTLVGAAAIAMLKGWV